MRVKERVGLMKDLDLVKAMRNSAHEGDTSIESSCGVGEVAQIQWRR